MYVLGPDTSPHPIVMGHLVSTPPPMWDVGWTVGVPIGSTSEGPHLW